jgi:uncharacterized protein (TIGR03118 family)
MKDGGLVPGQGRGFVDVCDTGGPLLQRVVSRGALNAPSSVVLSPVGFGSISGDLLVADAGNGPIGVYDPSHHFAFRGQLRGAQRRPVTIPGLKAIQFGNGVSSGDANALYFTAAPNNGSHGLFGSLRGASGS